MKFSFLRQKVVPNRAYMLRNDGKLLDCGKQSVHPYILFKDVAESAADVAELLANDEIYQDQFNWCMKFTAKSTTKQLFKKLIPELIKLASESDDIGAASLRDLFDYYDDVSNVDIAYIDNHVNLLNNEIKQEFLRIRVGDKYQNVSSGNDIYFRVSSVGFNWFNLIWNIVNDNKSTLDSVTVCKDKDSTGSDSYYSHNGDVMHAMSVNEFLTLSGNPVVESFDNFIIRKFYNGISITEAFGDINTGRINLIYNQLRNKELTM